MHYQRPPDEHTGSPRHGDRHAQPARVVIATADVPASGAAASGVAASGVAADSGDQGDDGRGAPGPARPLERLSPLCDLEIAGFVAALAEMLAHRHEAGAAHGGVAPDRILVAHDGRPMLSAIRADGATAGDDIAALGRLIDWMLDRAGVVRPRRRRRARHRDGRSSAPPADAAPRRRLAPLWSPAPVDVLADLVARCCDTNAAGRPTARMVVRIIRSGIPGAHLPDPASDVQRALPSPAGAGALFAEVSAAVRARRSRRRRRLIAAAATVALCTAVGITMALRSTSAGIGPPAGVLTAAALAVADDGVLALGRHRYAVGDGNDAVIRAAFSCRPPRVALLRLPTGSVHVFDRLPPPDGLVTGRLVASTRGAAGLDVARDRNGCPLLRVRHSDGRSTVVPVDEVRR